MSSEPSTECPRQKPSVLGWWAPLTVCVFLGSLFFLDPGGSLPKFPQGPGLTVDEMFNVGQGVRLIRGGFAVLVGELSLRELFHDAHAPGRSPVIGNYLPDHPPLGRLWLGIWHELTGALLPHDPEAGPFSAVNARIGSLAAFAFTLAVVALWVQRWYGAGAGSFAVLVLTLMPRLFGHAHLAALETVLGLTWTAAVAAIALRWSSAPRDQPPSTRTAFWTGILFGLLLLTKIQGVLLPIPVAIWACWNWRLRAWKPLLVWGATGAAIFFAGWPWLWFDPLNHLSEYLLRTTVRTTIYNFYLGTRYADVDVPWHYPWVMFGVTVPLGLHLLGGLGGWRIVRDGWKSHIARKQPAETSSTATSPPPAGAAAGEWLVLACVLFPLFVFSWPGVAVYDGARLFLIVFPLWGVVVCRGVMVLDARLHRWPLRARRCGLAALLLLGTCWGGLRMTPIWLSYYNLAVGGPAGAARLGLEQNYWGDALTRDLLEATAAKVETGAEIKFFPLLHTNQLRDLQSQAPLLRKRRLRLIPWDGDPHRGTQYVLIFSRRADVPPELQSPERHFDVLAAVTRGGSPLATLLRAKPNREQSSRPPTSREY